MLASRFLVDRKGGLSSGVSGVCDLPEGLDARRRERVETFDEVRRLFLMIALLLWSAATDPCE